MTVVVDQYRSVEEGAIANPPRCPECGQPMDFIYATTAMDVGGVKGAGFKAFDTFDGRGRPVRIENLRALRKLEKESEQQYRDGAGQPLTFRMWSQGDSNRDARADHRDWSGGEQPTPAAAHTFGASLQRSIEEPDQGFGPGVHEGNASALGMGADFTTEDLAE
jgi:hypothetical protein